MLVEQIKCLLGLKILEGPSKLMVHQQRAQEGLSKHQEPLEQHTAEFKFEKIATLVCGQAEFAEFLIIPMVIMGRTAIASILQVVYMMWR